MGEHEPLPPEATRSRRNFINPGMSDPWSCEQQRNRDRGHVFPGIVARSLLPDLCFRVVCLAKRSRWFLGRKLIGFLLLHPFPFNFCSSDYSRTLLITSFIHRSLFLVFYSGIAYSFTHTSQLLIVFATFYSWTMSSTYTFYSVLLKESFCL